MSVWYRSGTVAVTNGDKTVNGVQVSSFTVSAKTLGAIDSSTVGGAYRLGANVAGTVTVEFSGGSSAGTISLDGAVVQVFKAYTGTFA